MPAPQEVIKLIENFERNLDAYRSGKYNETQVRRDFIDPLFKALGWDMDNSVGYAEAYRDVIHEDAIKIGLSTKAPDYSFRVGGQRKFFLEAKKPSVNVKNDVEPAYQLRRYAWSAKLPLSIVTDFEEFAIYDCRQKPDKGDKASKSRLFYCTFRDYAEKWDEIAAIFSKDAVLKGSFDKYAVSTKGKRGTTEVDSAFLQEIEGWRDLLARNIALRNANLSQRELNFAVQQTIDRIIFLRICEDRGIEPYGKLMVLQNGVRVYDRLREMFRDADDRYNSGLFHFKREKGRPETPDELTLTLEIDDKPLKEIFKNLYYPDCPYEFSVLGAEILGSVYEQFLGKVIRLTAGNRAVVEDKPEVKKAGGVFYTPAYIVKYIVEHTVGKLLEGKTSKQAAGITILDPACGSGSFLIGAYQYLLDWYLVRYVEEGADKRSKGKEARLRSSASGEWRLTTAEKKRILLEHIYGVDIDAQAVEVTKLSLLLKVLEGESDQTLTSQMKLFHERVLPDLEHNIQCGNSLIGPDFYDGQLELDVETVQRINVFDWQAAFPHIFPSPQPLSPQAGRGRSAAEGEGGFDAVIGNPPYGAFLSTEIKVYLGKLFPFVSDYETSQYFICAAERISKNGGYISFIVPNTLFLNLYAKNFRKFVATTFKIECLTDLSDMDVFKGATVRTTIPLLVKGGKINLVKFSKFVSEGTTILTGKINQNELIQNDQKWLSNAGDVKGAGIREGVSKISILLSDILDVSQGLIPYDKYRGHDEATIKNRIWHADHKKDKTYKHELRGGDATRYVLKWNGKQWISYGPWLAAPRKQKFFTEPRLLFREITDPKTGLLHVAYTDEEFYNNPGIINCISRDSNYSLFYILGIVNSKLISYLHFSASPKARKGVFPKILVNDVRNLPIRRINFDDQVDRSRHVEMVRLVEKMLALNKQLNTAKTPQDTTMLQRQITATDNQIDQLAYQLYGLTEEEIALVEGAS